MRTTAFVGTLFLIGLLGIGTVATNGDSSSPVRQSAIVKLTEPTQIASVLVEGVVLFTHDKAKMARGEPCTSVYLFDRATGPGDKIVSFHCIPTTRKVVHEFTITTRPNEALGFGCVLTEFQFAGDAEGHGVPGTSALASAEGFGETVRVHR